MGRLPTILHNLVKLSLCTSYCKFVVIQNRKNKQTDKNQQQQQQTKQNRQKRQIGIN